MQGRFAKALEETIRVLTGRPNLMVIVEAVSRGPSPTLYGSTPQDIVVLYRIEEDVQTYLDKTGKKPAPITDAAVEFAEAVGRELFEEQSGKKICTPVSFGWGKGKFAKTFHDEIAKISVEAKGASTDPRQAPPTSVQRDQAKAKNGLWTVPAGLVVGQKCLKPAKDAKGGKGAEWPQLLDLTRMLKLDQVQCTGPGTGGGDAASSSGSGGGSSEAGAAGGGSSEAGGEASAKAALQRVLLRSPADASDVYTAVTGVVRSKGVAPILIEVAGRGSHGLLQRSRGSSVHKKGGRSNRDTKSGGGLGRYLTRWDALWWNDETASGGNAEANAGSRRATKGGNSGGTSRGGDGAVGIPSGDQRFSYGRVAAEGGGGVGGGAGAGTGSGGGSGGAAQPSRARVVLLNRRSMKYCGDEVPVTAEGTNTKTQEGLDVEAGKMTCSHGTVGRGEVFELTMLEPPAPSGAGAGPKAVVSLRSGRTGMFCRAAGKKKGVLCDKPTVGPKEHFQLQLVFFGAPAWQRPKPTTSPGPYVPPPDLAAEQSKGLPKPEAVFPLPLGGPDNHVSGPPTKGAAVPSSMTVTAYPPKQQPTQLWINATVIAHEMAVYIGSCPVCKPADDETLWQYRLSWRCMLDNTCGKHRCRVCALHQFNHPQCEKCPGPFAPVRNMAPPPLATPSPAAATSSSSGSGSGSGSSSTSSSKTNSSSASSDANSAAASGGGSGSSADTPAPAPGPAPAPCNDPFGNFNLALAPKYVCGGGVATVYLHFVVEWWGGIAKSSEHRGGGVRGHRVLLCHRVPFSHLLLSFSLSLSLSFFRLSCVVAISCILLVSIVLSIVLPSRCISSTISVSSSRRAIGLCLRPQPHSHCPLRRALLFLPRLVPQPRSRPFPTAGNDPAPHRKPP